MARRFASGIPTWLSISTARSHASRLGTFLCRATASAIWSPHVKTGLSDVIGSWKIIEIALPRTSRISSSAELEQVAAVELDLARDDLAGALDQAHDRERGDALAAAGLADDAERLAVA